MSRFLFIETTTNVCSVALSDENEIIALKESSEDRAHAKILAPFIREILDENKLETSDLDAVVLSKGPGSYTGLRIGVATAKGIAYASDIPLIAISTLRAMAYGFVQKNQHPNALFIPMIDARRMEVYSAVYDNNNKGVRAIQADIIDEKSYSEYLSNSEVYFFGDGAPKCKDVITSERAHFIDNFDPSAAYMHHLAMDKWKNKDFEDVAYFEPFYLKDFIATVAKKNIFK